MPTLCVARGESPKKLDTTGSGKLFYYFRPKHGVTRFFQKEEPSSYPYPELQDTVNLPTLGPYCFSMWFNNYYLYQSLDTRDKNPDTVDTRSVF